MEINLLALSKLKIETTSSSSQEEEEEEKDKRNWLELPQDVMSLVFLKLGYIDILGSAQWVCSSWWKLSKQPHLYRSIHVEKGSTIFECSLIDPLNSTAKSCEGLVRKAIERSCGQLVEFSIRAIHINDKLLQYMSEISSSLRSLRLVKVRLVNIYETYDDFVTEDGFIEEIAKKLPHLEELGIIKCSYFSKDVIETFGRVCPQLKSCQLNFVSCFWTEIEFKEVAISIAENMPELCHLNLFGNLVKDDDLRAFLDGCPHLESLDLRRCSGLNFGGDLIEWCKNIKMLRLPNDPTDDFEYDSDDEYKLYDGILSDHYADHCDGYASSW